MSRQKDPLSDFSSTLSGTYCVPLTVLGLGKKDNVLKPRPSGGSQANGQADCLWSKEK